MVVFPVPEVIIPEKWGIFCGDYWFLRHSKEVIHGKVWEAEKWTKRVLDRLMRRAWDRSSAMTVIRGVGILRRRNQKFSSSPPGSPSENTLILGMGRIRALCGPRLVVFRGLEVIIPEKWGIFCGDYWFLRRSGEAIRGKI